MTAFVILRWWVWLAAAGFGVLLAFAATNLIGIRRPRWTSSRRSLSAALVAPALIMAGTLVGALLVSFSAEEGDWSDLAMAALLQIGVLLALVTFVAGLATAALMERSRKS